MNNLEYNDIALNIHCTLIVIITLSTIIVQ